MATLLVDGVNQEFSAAPGSADGTLVGRNTTTPVGFFGTVPIVQPTLTAAASGAGTAGGVLVALGLAKQVG